MADFIVDPECRNHAEYQAWQNAIREGLGVRLIFADWLDEHGEHEEATRQRAYDEMRGRVEAFAYRYRFTCAYICQCACEGRGLVFSSDDHPEGFDQQMWEALEVVCGQRFDRVHRDRTDFRCAC